MNSFQIGMNSLLVIFFHSATVNCAWQKRQWHVCPHCSATCSLQLNWSLVTGDRGHWDKSLWHMQTQYLLFTHFMQPGRAGTASSDMVMCIVTPANHTPPRPLPRQPCARTLQWLDFGKKVRNPTKCPILVRIWWDFKVSGEIWRNLVEILRFIHMIMYDISIFTLSIAVFDPVLPPTSVNQLDN